MGFTMVVKSNSIKKSFGSFTLELAVLCILMVACAISFMASIRDAYYDEILHMHQILGDIVLVGVQDKLDSMCFFIVRDNEGSSTGTDLGTKLCDGTAGGTDGQFKVRFADSIIFDGLNINQNEYTNPWID